MTTLPAPIAGWNQTRKAYPLGRPLTSFLEEQARKTPDLPAVTFEGTTLSYRELNQRANRLARHLGAHGIATDALVGVYLERSIEMVVALVGIVKAGAAYVPLDPEYPPDRLSFMFEDSQIRVLVTQRKLAPPKLDRDLEVVYLDDPTWSALAAADRKNPALQSTPDSAVYMIYTSGSTGKPKGVVNVHQGLVNRLLWMQEAFPLTQDDRVLQKTPYSFDVSVWEFFWPLMTGACIVVAKPGGHRDSHYLVDTIVGQRVTTLHFVPSMLSLFLASDELDRIKTLRQVMASGEALPLELCRRFFAKLPGTALHNLYGPTEAAIDVTHWACTPESTRNVVPIGRPIANTQTYILDEKLAPVAIGDEGELYLGGIGLARGYWNRPELTAERFVPDPFGAEPGARLYKTGDLARYLPDGAIEYLGRLDFQIKLRGFRIELGEIEAVLLKVPGVLEATVIATDEKLDERQLIAYLVARPEQRPSAETVRSALRGELPDYMVPSRFVFLEEMPLLPNGKVNRKALPKSLLERPELSEMYIAPKTPLEKQLCEIWGTLLGVEKVGIRDNFFDLGGNSIRAVRLAAELKRALHDDIPLVKIFEYPSIEKFAAYLASGSTAPQGLDDAYERATRMRIGRFSGEKLDGVAVIGMVGRFPGARDLDELWANLCNKVESIERFPLDEIDVEDEIKRDPAYVPTRGIIDDADKFDARFFGIGPLEAKAMDPQQRVFLELAWAALEHAGYDSERFPGLVGVYAGVGDNHYYPNNLLGHPDLLKTVGGLIVGYGNQKDYIATRVSYTLNLTGPSVSANTGCSTSLLAVDHAFKGLVDFECDMALAGGVDIFVPQRSGQLYKEGGTFTRDGHCRPFDHEASGTMFCDGAGIVVLRRLEDAVAAGDRIYGVIRGIAKNNDGANKVSFLAPGVEGQVRVIALAQAQANVPARTISYHEAHGTGTPLGDPIEVEAATRAFRATTADKQFCHLGSLKGNIGHPTIASGVAGLIKVCLALHHEKIPATINFTKPNPRINFADSPFKLVTENTPWPRTSTPRRGSVSSFGFGGTNVHAVLEEAPVQPASGPARAPQLVLLSGKSEAAVARLRDSYRDFVTGKTATELADMAYTTQVGRRHLACRQFIVAGNAEEASAALASAATAAVAKVANVDPNVVFMFPGQGSQFPHMGQALHDSEPVVREAIDSCCGLFRPHLGRELTDLIFPAPGSAETAAALLKDTRYTQPALFTIEYALARYWMSLGITPTALVGHSVAEFVCACIADALALEDAVALVALRGRLMGSMPPGSMLSVRAAAAAIKERLPADIHLAANNAPNLCVVAGPTEAINGFAATLEKEGVVARPLQTSHAFHSAMMEPIVGEFMAAVGKTRFSAPRIPILSTCLADWMTAETMASPEYWGKQLRSPVLFSDAITKLAQEPGHVFLEVGPKDVLSALTRQHVPAAQRGTIVTSLGGGTDGKDELAAFRRAVGNLWLCGKSIDWNAFHAAETRRRIAMPTYPFERTSYWVEPVRLPGAVRAAGGDGRSGDPALRSDDGHAEAGAAAAPATVLDRIKGMLATVGGIPAASVDPAKTYIEMGFDSLSLMQLEVVVGQELGIKVGWRQLLEEYATPAKLEGLARTLHPALESVPTERPVETPAPVATTAPGHIQGLTMLREAGPRSVFLAYDGEGDVLQYLKLARAMPNDFSIYGISPLRLPKVPQAHTTVEEMAAHCVSVTRRKQPRGPYIVGGLCAGGVIAFEMARQLEAASERVDRVILLDAINPQTPFRPFLETGDRLRHFLANRDGTPATKQAGETAAAAGPTAGAAQPSRTTAASAPAGLAGQARYTAERVRNLVAYELRHQVDNVWIAVRVRILRQIMRRGGKWPERLAAPSELEIYMSIKGEYRPATIASDILLVRATMDSEGVDTPARHYVADPFYGWQGHTTGKLEVIDAAGGHVSMLLDEPWFGELAEKLAAALLGRSSANEVVVPAGEMRGVGPAACSP